MITPRTTGIIGVHVWGQPCNVTALTEIAQKHSLKLMFDASHAFGCSYQDE
jgi:dTDP-4-amino-4,6-dideoxygalactose transaminase